VEAKIRVEYLHSDIDAIERVEILRNLRLGNFDVLVASTSCAKDSICRGRARRDPRCGQRRISAERNEFDSNLWTCGPARKRPVIFYADKQTDSIKRTIEVTTRREKNSLPTTRAWNHARGVKRSAQAA